MNILVIKLGALGDVLMSTPAIHFIKQCHPESKIHFVVNEEYKSAIQNNPEIFKIYTIPKCESTGITSKLKRLTLFAKVALHNRKQKFDILFCLHLPKILHILSYLWNTKRVISLPNRKKNWLRYHGLVNIETVAKGFNVNTNQYIDLKMRYTPRGNTNFVGPDNNYIIIHPAGGINTGEIVTIKRWPLEHWVYLATVLIQNFPQYSVVITGGKGEQPIADAIQEQVPACINLCAKTTLDELYVLQARASTIVSNDTGALHLAGATETPIVALFGPTDSKELAPQHNCIVVETPLKCAPCYYGTFSGCSTGLKNCMETIAPSVVIDKLIKILQ